MLQNLWGRPPGLRGTPSSRSPPVESRPCTRRWPTRASAADEGVRPTIYADVRLWENYVALPSRSRFGVRYLGQGEEGEKGVGEDFGGAAGGAEAVGVQKLLVVEGGRVDNGREVLAVGGGSGV